VIAAVNAALDAAAGGAALPALLFVAGKDPRSWRLLPKQDDRLSSAQQLRFRFFFES
jgi:hypothetical protein